MKTKVTSPSPKIVAYLLSFSILALLAFSSFGQSPTPTPCRTIFAVSSTTPIVIPDNGPANLYPSSIEVSGRDGTISDLTVTIKSIAHQSIRDVNLLLVGPSGQAVRLMENAGTGEETASDLTFSDVVLSALPASGGIASGTYRPTAYPPAITYPSPAPAGPYATTLSIFNLTTPNGTWSLYVYDSVAPSSGQIAGGWELNISTTGCATPTPTETPTPTTTPTPSVPPTPSPIPSPTPVPTPCDFFATFSNTTPIVIPEIGPAPPILPPSTSPE